MGARPYLANLLYVHVVEARVWPDDASLAADLLDDGGGVGGAKDEGVAERFAVCKGGADAGTESVAGASGIFDFDAFIESNAIGFLVVSGNSALVAGGDDGGGEMVF